MKQKKIIGCIVLLIIVTILGCLGVKIYKNKLRVNIQNQLMNEFLPGKTKLGNSIEEVVELEVDNVGKDKVIVIVKAPNINGELIEWVENVEGEIGEEELEKKIISLLQQSEKNENTCELTYEDEEGIKIVYTETYLDAVSCGLNEFYNYAMNQTVLEILEEKTNE